MPIGANLTVTGSKVRAEGGTYISVFPLLPYPWHPQHLCLDMGDVIVYGRGSLDFF